MLLSLATSAFFNNYPIGALGLVSWNYGLNRVRFPETVYLEDRIRMSVQLSELVQKNVGWLLTNHVVLEIEGRQQPAMVADFLVMMTAVDADISGEAL
jgi:acyl dehydratase